MFLIPFYETQFHFYIQQVHFQEKRNQIDPQLGCKIKIIKIHSIINQHKPSSPICTFCFARFDPPTIPV